MLRELLYRKSYHDRFESLGIDPELAISCVSTMFPVFAKDVNGNLYGYQPISDIRAKMRVAHKGRFELYFMFDLDDVKVSRNIIDACIFEIDKDALSSAIKEINKQSNIVYFLEEIQSLVNKIPYARLSLIASVILDLQGGFEGEKSGNFSISACGTAEYLAQ